MTARSFTFGGHNLHDQAGTPAMFADAVIFTEAIPTTIRARLQRANLRRRNAVIVCAQQRDLVVALNRGLFKVTGRQYEQHVQGRAKVTPNRGTFTVFTIHRPTGTRIAFVAEHRINAAFFPYKRGEAGFRSAAWKSHTAATNQLIRRLDDSRWLVCAGGDLNTPHNVDGYNVIGLNERGQGFDRLAATVPMHHISTMEVLSRGGSDHPRTRVTVTL